MRQIATIATLLILLVSVSLNGQRRNKKKEAVPVTNGTELKLVVGLVVDQMRFDYLTRFWNHYGNGGFKRLANQGFNCKNNHFNYVPTYTAPGHASVYTGTSPAVHGIIGNDWFDKESGQSVYCVSDPDQNPLGTQTEAGKMSPHRLLVTTITDQLRLHHQMRSKTIAISLKDRGAVLPGGHTANAAYWFEGGAQGKWISSTYYMDQLPKWVQDFNASNSVEQYKTVWNTFKPIEQYVESGPDNNRYEGLFIGETQPTFPHDLPALYKDGWDYELLKSTPFGNNLVIDFAKEAIKAEGLGQDAIPDFLAMSFSSTDYIGHKYGVDSKEVQDAYVRLDHDLSAFLSHLDKTVGAGSYMVFLTADHGAIHVPNYLKDKNIPAGYLQTEQNRERLNEYLRYRYGTTDIVRNISNYQVFLDRKIINNLDMDLAKAQEEIALELIQYPNIDKVFTGSQLWQNNYTHGLAFLLQNGWHQKRSGDVMFVQEPGYITYPETGSTHGSPMNYDTHVPLLFYGHGIKNGSTARKTSITDIAPTLSVILGCAFPNGATGIPITEVIK